MRRSMAMIRWAFATIAAYCCLFVLCTTGITVCVFTLGWKKHAYFYLICRCFGYTYLKLNGIRLTLSEGLPYTERDARIIVFNHASQLDLFIMAALMPPGGVPTMKKEMLFIPVLGQILWCFGALMINRQNGSSARASLDDGARRMREQGLSVALSPEGTRSADGSLGNFKKGTFHLAKATGVAVDCLYFDGPHHLQPLGQNFAYSGEIKITKLHTMRSPLPTDTAADWTGELRGIFAEKMG